MLPCPFCGETPKRFSDNEIVPTRYPTPINTDRRRTRCWKCEALGPPERYDAVRCVFTNDWDKRA